MPDVLTLLIVERDMGLWVDDRLVDTDHCSDGLRNGQAGCFSLRAVLDVTMML